MKQAVHPIWASTRLLDSELKCRSCIYCEKEFSANISKKSERIVAHIRSSCPALQQEDFQATKKEILDAVENYQKSDSSSSKKRKSTNPLGPEPEPLKPKIVNPLSLVDLTLPADDADVLEFKRSSNSNDKERMISKKSQLQQSDIRDHMKPVTEKNKATFKRLWARFVYSSGVSFNCNENEALIAALNLAAPGYDLPSRKSLANGLLDSEYNLLKKEMADIIKEQ
jgi:hypothetical protein